jgi:hypothetical protein
LRLSSTAFLALVALGACQGPAAESSGFTTTPGITTVPGDTSGESSSSSSSSGTTTTGDGGSGSGGIDTSTEPTRDLGGMPDFGPPGPVGCKGKIDFLFMVSRQANMQYRQAQLALAVPQFIETIQEKFEDFDYHIMVVDGDGGSEMGWGVWECNGVCPNLECKENQACCPSGMGSDEPCCPDPNYPCASLDLVTPCDTAWGAGTVFPAGPDTADKPCPLEPGLRYIKKGDPNLAQTFECIAMIGAGGWDSLGQALTAAVQPGMNDIGGCNAGFLRDDALLMVTFIANTADEPTLGSEGTPKEWAQAVLDAKHGDDKSVVMFAIGGLTPCKPADRICLLTEMFHYHHHVFFTDDYGMGFSEAASLVEAACAGFTPPPG